MPKQSYHPAFEQKGFQQYLNRLKRDVSKITVKEKIAYAVKWTK